MSAGPAAGRNTALIREAAILLLAMGEDEAAKALKLLDPGEVQRVGAAMAAIGSVHGRQIDRVVNRFLETVSGAPMGANDYLKKMLLGAVGERRVRAGRTRPTRERKGGGSLGGLDTLRWMDDRALADFLLREPVQIRAIVLSYLQPARGARVLALLPGDAVQADLVVELAALESNCPRGLQDPAPPAPQRAVRHTQVPPVPLGGPRAAAALLGRLDAATQARILAVVGRRDPPLAECLLALMAPAPVTGSSP